MFFGNYDPLSIGSILIIKTSSNYRAVISAITLFDNILSCNFLHQHNKVSTSLLSKSMVILKQLLNDEQKDTFDKFIYTAFTTFARHKTQIKLGMCPIWMKIQLDEWMKFLFGESGLGAWEYNCKDEK